MAFVKVQKSKAYFKRYQVKYRRRREGKTDYHARRRLVLQDKNKYNAHKNRLIVRITSTRIICQIAYATLQGDIIIAAANSSELKNYGIPIGLTNYAAAYATGLLVARRLLSKMGVSDSFEGVKVADGEEFHIEESAEDRRPFKCILDVGITMTTTGNRVFGAMKGACDGGVNVPHNTKRFPGHTKDSYDASKHKERIFGLHVAAYMKSMQEEEPEKYAQHFSHFIKNKVDPDGIEKMYAEAHKKIRAEPNKVFKIPGDEPNRVRVGDKIKTSKGAYVRNKKLTCAERKERVYKKMEMVSKMVLESS